MVKIDSGIAAKRAETANTNINKTVSKPKTNTTTTRADIGVVTAKLQEKNFAAEIKKADITSKFDVEAKTATTATATAKATKEVDYFEIDKQADELIKKHTDDGFFSDSLKTDDLGRELAEIAKTEPERAAALNDNILDKISNGDKDEVAQSFVEALSPSELREFAANERGKESLEQLKGHLLTGSVHGDERATATRIDNAIKAADFMETPEFKALSPDTQAEVTSRLDAQQGNQEATDNLIRLTSNADFAKLPEATQKRMLEAFDANAEDSVFTDGLISTAAKTDFTGLTPAQQNQVISDMQDFAKTGSYNRQEGGFLGIGRRDIPDDEKAYMLDLVGNMSIYSQQNPTITSVRNSLDKVLSEEIKLEAYSEPAKDGFITFGTASGDTMRMNMHADARRGVEKTIDTFVHEVNHIVNGHTDAGTPDRFMDEYRARIVGREAGGETFDAAMQREALDTLVKSGAYGHLKELYEENADFAAVIDDAYAGLNETPPRLTTHEQLRQNLVDAGFDTDYLTTPGNLDNR